MAGASIEARNGSLTWKWETRSRLLRIAAGRSSPARYMQAVSRCRRSPGESTARTTLAACALSVLAAVQWSSTVRFRETIEGMHRDGVRLFLEIGPRSNLTGFTDDVLRSKPHAAIPSNVQHRSGIVQLHHMLGQLVAHGLTPKLEHLYARRAPRPVTEKIKPKRSLALATGLQPARLPAGFALPKPATPHPAPVAAAPPP